MSAFRFKIYTVIKIVLMLNIITLFILLKYSIFYFLRKREIKTHKYYVRIFQQTIFHHNAFINLK